MKDTTWSILNKLRNNALDQHSNISLMICLILFKISKDFKDELEFLRKPHKLSEYVDSIDLSALEINPKVSTLKEQLHSFPVTDLLNNIPDDLIIDEVLQELTLLDFSKDISRGDYLKISNDFMDMQSYLLSTLGKANGITTTPKEISYLLKECLNVQQDESLLDPCLGSGNMAILIGENAIKIEGQDVNTWYHSISEINAIVSNKDITVFKGDSILDPQFNEADVVISNIPFGMKLQNINEDFLNWDKPSKRSGDFHFTSLLLSYMKNRGAIVLPEGALFRSGDDGLVRGNIANAGFISAVLSLPPNLFNNTSIATSIIIFDKKTNNDEILFIDTKAFFKPIRGGVETTIDKLKNIVDIFKNKTLIDGVSVLKTKEELKSNDYILTVNRYVSNLEDLKIIDTAKLAKELETLESDIQSYQSKTNNLINKIRGEK